MLVRCSLVISALVLGLFDASAPASAGPSPAGVKPRSAWAAEPPPPFMHVFSTTPAHYGWVQFCKVFPEECREDQRGDQRIELTPDKLSELQDVNRSVNERIHPITDRDHFGVRDWWTLPLDGAGDCKDFQLQKRHELMALGWPASALLITVVLDENNEGHAVLTVRAADGDYILDNKTSEIKLWRDTPYTYLMRQSFLHPNVWMSLDSRLLDPSISLAAIIAGNNNGPLANQRPAR